MGETWLRAYERREDYDTHQALLPWLKRICQNVCIDQYRDWRRKKKSEEDACPIPDCSAVQRDRGLEDHVRAMLRHLPGREREVLVLALVYRQDSRSVANLLGIRPGSARQALLRGRRRLRRLLRRSGDAPG